jgi:hypothetical protein
MVQEGRLDDLTLPSGRLEIMDTKKEVTVSVLATLRTNVRKEVSSNYHLYQRERVLHMLRVGQLSDQRGGSLATFSTPMGSQGHLRHWLR